MKKATIYSKAGCGACVTAKTFMEGQNIEFKEIAVDKDKDAMKELVSKGVMSLPFIKIGDKEIMGFNPNAILEAAKE